MGSTRILAVMAMVMLAGGLAGARADENATVLAAIRAMPEGGGYAVTSEAGRRFREAVSVEGGKLRVAADGAVPSYCSSATYLLLLKVIEEGRRAGRVELSAEALAALAPRAVPDGRGMWGRWNANGPGTARVFRELGVGRNFTDFADARAGDFLKIFWRDAVGKNERGHLVVYLGTEMVDGEEHVRFWSANQPDGYGEKSVPRTKVVRAIFSRLENVAGFARVAEMPRDDEYLASLLETESSFDEACRLSGVER